MERKEVDTQQFIDHTLLANHFIMDLIDQTYKSEGPTNLSTNPSSGNSESGVGYVEKESLTPELNFHNTIFQFVNKSSPENDVVPHQADAQPTFPALAIEPTVPIDVSTGLHEDEDLLYAHNNASCTNARKVLPHKKRISRKLKGNIDPDLDHQHKHVQDVTPSSLYSCEICGYAVHTQLDFFAHLKQHYEPTVLEQRLVVQDPQQQHQQKEPLDMCGLSAQDKLQQEQAKLDQVFQDVQLNFENFHNISHHVNDVANVGVNMVLHGQPTDKLNTVVVNTSSTPNSVPVVDDVEFSDTEDMLEGIRNVVLKVSIEDTCDELVDLELTSSGMTAPWFNNNFRDITFPALLMPGEPPPASSEPATPLLKENPHVSDHMALDFLSPEKADPQEEPKLEKSLSKACEPNEQTLLVAPPACQTPPIPSVPPANSSIEQLRRSPLELSEAFKLEEDDMTDSRPASSFEKGDADAEEPNESFQMEVLDTSLSEEAENKTRRKHFCDKCNRDFNSYNALKYHQYTHNQQRSHKCESCERSFYTQSALKAHERTHSGVKPFKCDKCDFQFRQWGDLKYHIISRHSDVKAHMCEFCGKSFSRRYSLVVHRRIHTREKNYACQYCDKTFRASSYLLSHIKVHTGERPYECSICEKKFRVSGDLKRHSRIHDPSRASQPPAEKAKKKRAAASNKQMSIEEDDEVATNTQNHKSDAMREQTGQKILGL
ncbi:zinc finger imprinted 2 [Drosophila sechellia]|uniref:GM18118 n=1 Tax=Drosophila sechellia TaxID=7238 RepID=B4I341_DROSE|nr:zinc finger imprinted 2 [Drosophila sechellia]EDW54186.1 GM18118 [Drosophila sechellia]